MTGRGPALAVILSLSLAACRSDPAVASGAIAVIDDAGDTVRLRAPARRIVSLIPAATEILVAAGLGGRVVGRTAWCDWPPDAVAIPSVGGGMPPNIEAVVGRTPDLVLLYRTGANAEAVARFRSLGIAAAQLRTDRVADIARTARLLAPLTNAGAGLERVAAGFERELRRATAGVPATISRPSILLLAWPEPPIALGAGGFMSELLERAGGRNAFDDVAAASAAVSLEAIAARRPAAVFLADSGAGSALQRPEWRAVPAVRAGRVTTPLEPALTRAGLRAPAAVRKLRRILVELAPGPDRLVTFSPRKALP